MVSVPLAECGDRPKGASGEGPPPSDSWAWRKYGQKPIKGSPYPRYVSIFLLLIHHVLDLIMLVIAGFVPD